MEKPKQDKKVKANQEEIDIFFGYVCSENKTTEDFKEIKEMLKEQPSLVHSKTKNGNTALYLIISMGRKEDLETAKILMAHGADPKESKVGRALQFDMDPYIRNEMAKITLGVDLNTHSNVLKEADKLIAKSQKYNAQLKSNIHPSPTPTNSAANRNRGNYI